MKTTIAPIKCSGCGRHTAFTLVELLVVITVVILLLALLLPSLSEARELSRQVICLSNQRQLFIAADAYSTDSKDGMPALTYSLIGPMVISGNSSTVDQAGRRSFLANYTTAAPALISNSWQVTNPVKYMFCPSGVRWGASLTPPNSNYNYYNYVISNRSSAIDYFVSGAGQFYWGGQNDDCGQPLKRFSAMSMQNRGGQKVVFSMDFETTYQQATGQVAAASQGPITWYYTPHKRDLVSRGMNAVYVDGSGKWCRYDSVPTNAPAGANNGVQVQWSAGSLGGGQPTYFPFLYPANSQVVSLWTNTGLVSASNDPTIPPASVFIYSSDRSIATWNGGSESWASGWYPAQLYGY